MTHRSENNCSHDFQRDTLCLNCGVYQYRDPAMKSTLYNTPSNIKFHHYLTSLRRQSSQPIQCKQLSTDTYLLLISICQKFQFTPQTFSLGLTLYQRLHRLHLHQRFWSSCCLIVAAKAIQLDKNVPYLSRYQRYAQKSFTQQDYEEAQRTIFATLQFQVHFTTFVSFLQFYLTCGFIFKSDSLSPTLIHFLEDDAILRAKELLRKGTFPQKNPEILALTILKNIRIKYALESWPMQLQEMSGYKGEELNALDKMPLEQSFRTENKSEIKNYSTNKIENKIENKNEVVNISKNKTELIHKGSMENSSSIVVSVGGTKIDLSNKNIALKYTTIGKMAVKENCFSLSRPMLAPLKSKHNQLSLMMGQYNSTSSVDLLNRRR